MKDSCTKVLLIESRVFYADLIKILLNASYDSFEVEWATTMAEAFSLLDDNEYHIILTDIMLGDAGGHEVIQQLTVQRPDTPIVALMEDTNISLGRELISHGAQDFLALRELSICILKKSIYYALERVKLTDHLKGMSVTDDLTGLCNRRGFRNLAEQQLRITERTKRTCSFLFIDLDNLKQINDTHGHQAGDRAIQDTALSLKEALRSTDIIGRLGGDEFVVLAPDTLEYQARKLIGRLRLGLEDMNQRDNVPYILSASTGLEVYSGHKTVLLEDIQAAACKKMYKEKKGKKEART